MRNLIKETRDAILEGSEATRLIEEISTELAIGNCDGKSLSTKLNLVNRQIRDGYAKLADAVMLVNIVQR